MTPEQIAELEALAEKATPGPWEVEEDPTQDGDHATLVCLSGKFGTMGTWLLGCFHNWKEAARGERRISWKEAESNASLIVALRNNLPAILAALKAHAAPAVTQPDEDVVERVATAIHAYCCHNMVMTYLDEDEDCEGLARAAIAALKAQQPGEDVVERVARVIDPGSWAVMDGYLADMKRKYRGQNVAYDPDNFKHKGSMATARTAIAAMQENPDD